MTTPIRVPQLGESVVEATVGQWLVKEGDAVTVGDPIVSLETDKVDVEVGAEVAGVIQKIERQSGEDVAVGDVLGQIDPDGAAPSAVVSQPVAQQTNEPTNQQSDQPTASPLPKSATPVAQRMAADKGIDINQIEGSGPGGKVTKQDVTAHASQPTATSSSPTSSSPTSASPTSASPAASSPAASSPPTSQRERAAEETRERMSRRRRTIATRLVEAQQTAAMLTTFNEVDMGAVIDMRKRRQEQFVKQNDIKLGFMSFFVKAVVGALKAYPRLNAEIDGDDMVLKHYYDIGMAVGAEEGLVVPVVRDADRLSFPQIEHSIKNLARKAQDGSLSLADLRGGTFTITNGGIFGSMLSTPILNPPQVGILGLHNIVQRPFVVDGEIAIRPMMYVALSYDHRIVDGREAVQFLFKVKQLIEDPEALLLEG